MLLDERGTMLRRHTMAITVAALFVLYAYTSLLWLKIDHRPPRSDESTYLTISLYSYRMLRAGHPIAALNLRSVSDTKPGGVEFLSALSYFIVGEDEHTAIFLVNICGIMLTAFSLLLMSRLLYDSLAPGLIATLWIFSLRAVIVWLGYYLIDVQLMAVVAFTLALCMYLTKTEFRDPKAAVALMVTIAIGLTVKHMYAAFAGPPIALMLVLLLLSTAKKLITTACVIAGALVGTAYHVLNFHVIAEQIRRSSHPPDQGVVVYLNSIPKLFAQLVSDCTPLLIVLFIAGCVVSVYTSRSLILFPLLSGLGGWCTLSLATQQPWGYYLFPLLPSFGLICASVLISYRVLPKVRLLRPVSFALTAALTVFLIGVYLKRHLGSTNPIRLFEAASILTKPAREVKTNPLVDSNYWDIDYVDGNAATLPYPLDWKQKEMAEYIGSLVRDRTLPGAVALLSRSEWLSDYNVSYTLYKTQLEKKTVYRGGPLPVIKTPDDALNLGNILIFKWPKPFSPFEWQNPWTRDAAAAFYQLLADGGKLLKDRGYILGKSFSLPDHTSAYIWYKPDDGTLTLLDILDAAVVTPVHNNAALWMMKCADQTRRVLFEHPVPPPGVMSVTWQVHVKPAARLRFGIGISQDTWSPKSGDGVEFQIFVIEAGKERQLFAKYIDPKNNVNDRKWFDFDLPLNISGDEEVGIKLVTRPGPRGDITSDHAGWSDLRIVY